MKTNPRLLLVHRLVRPGFSFGATILVISVLMLGSTWGCKRKAPAAREATLDDLNRVLEVWSVTRPSPPQDVSELTNSMYMGGKRLPQPPPGKKLALDPSHRHVIWVDQ
jgi:hypothetical protein